MTESRPETPAERRPLPPGPRGLRTVGALMLREIATSHGRAALGYLWEIVEPVAGILLLTLLFSLMFTQPPLGTNFPLFYASGLLPFLVYSETAARVSAAVRFSRPLLTYPGVTFLDAILARFLLVAVSKAVVFALVIGAIVWAFRLPAFFDLPKVIHGFSMALALGLGIGTLNCLLTSLFPVWERVWALVNRPTFVISAVFFVYQGVPQPWRDWLWWNPIVHVVGATRAGIYPAYRADYVSTLYVMGIAAVTFLAGLFFLRRYYRSILYDL